MAWQLTRWATVVLLGARAGGAAGRCELPCPSPGRIMRPDDANIAGNVHGGTILKMIEEAGAIISTRHCNSQAGVSRHRALAGLYLGDSLAPLPCLRGLWVAGGPSGPPGIPGGLSGRPPTPEALTPACKPPVAAAAARAQPR